MASVKGKHECFARPSRSRHFLLSRDLHDGEPPIPGAFLLRALRFFVVSSLGQRPGGDREFTKPLSLSSSTN